MSFRAISPINILLLDSYSIIEFSNHSTHWFPYQLFIRKNLINLVERRSVFLLFFFHRKKYIYIYYSIVHSVFFQFRVDSLLTNSELICNKQNCTLTKYKSELCICRFFFLVEHSFFIGVMHCDAQCRLGWRTSLFEGLLLLRTATLFANSHTDDEMNGKM